MQFWNELEGQTIDGLFPLRRLVRSEGRSAWFETETPAPQAGRATISLTEALTDADEVTARLQAAKALKHPNLVTITQVGQVKIDTTLVVYAVMEPIEQGLSDVLQSQALSAEEGREVAEALVGALTAIHQNGMSHGHVEAASVLATEETVKLRSDCLQTNATSQAEDVAGVGNTLFHAFTQRKAANATDAMVNRIPAPFGEIVRNTMARRWSLAQVANAMKPAPPVAAPAPATAPVRRPDPPPSKTPEAAVPRPAPVPQPPAPSTPPPTPRPAPPAAAASNPVVPVPREQEAADTKRRPVALYTAVALIVLGILGWVLARPRQAPAPTATATAPALTQSPASPAPAVPVEKAPAGKPSPGTMNGHPSRKPAPVVTAVQPAAGPAARPPSDGRTIWRVVVYTYRGQSKAEDSVAKIKDKHPDLDAGVFNISGSDAYMVTLGGAMDHEQANAMLAKARQEGLPQDTYVRNFRQ